MAVPMESVIFTKNLSNTDVKVKMVVPMTAQEKGLQAVFSKYQDEAGDPCKYKIDYHRRLRSFTFKGETIDPHAS